MTLKDNLKIELIGYITIKYYLLNEITKNVKDIDVKTFLALFVKVMTDVSQDTSIVISR